MEGYRLTIKELEFIKKLTTQEMITYEANEIITSEKPKHMKYKILKNIGHKKQFMRFLTNTKNDISAYSFINKLIEFNVLKYYKQINNNTYFQLKPDDLLDFFKASLTYKELIRPIISEAIRGYSVIEDLNL